jgi:flagellar basal-body rod protein FlgB
VIFGRTDVAGFGLFGKTTLPALGRMMDLSAWRQRAYAANIANASSPGYRRRDVKFEDELRKSQGKSLSLEATHPTHIGSASPLGPALEVHEEPVEAQGTVDIEKETVRLAENQLRFNLAARLAALRIQSLRSSIRG